MQPNQTRHLAPSLKRSTGSFWTLAPHYLRQAGSWASAKGGQASRPSKLKTKKATQRLLFLFFAPPIIQSCNTTSFLEDLLDLDHIQFPLLNNT